MNSVGILKGMNIVNDSFDRTLLSDFDQIAPIIIARNIDSDLTKKTGIFTLERPGLKKENQN